MSPPTTIDRYIFKIAISSLFGLSFVIIGIVWLAQSLRFLEVIVNNDAGVVAYVSLIVFLIPELLALALPICLLIAGMNVYQKLIANHELTILRCSGYNNFRIARPFLFICCLCVLFGSFVNIYLTPLALKKFNIYRHTMESDMSTSLLHPGTFNTLKNVIVYVQNGSKRGTLKGLFVHSQPLPDKNGFILMAESGYFKKSNGQFKLILVNGHRQEIDKSGQTTFCDFSNFTYDLTDLIKNNEQIHIRPYERSLKELLNPDFVGNDLNLRNRMIVEGHQRILTPWICLLNGLILTAVILFGDVQRRKRSHKVFIGSIICASLHISTIALIQYAMQNIISIWWVYALLCFSMSLALYILITSRFPLTKQPYNIPLKG